MSAFIQNMIVAVVVIFALYSVAKRFAPAPLRRFLRRFFAQLATRLRLPAIARKFNEGEATQVASACGSCGGCSPGTPSGKARAVIAIKLADRDKTPCSSR